MRESCRAAVTTGRLEPLSRKWGVPARAVQQLWLGADAAALDCGLPADAQITTRPKPRSNGVRPFLGRIRGYAGEAEKERYGRLQTDNAALVGESGEVIDLPFIEIKIEKPAKCDLRHC